MDEEVRLLNEQVAQLRRMSEQELRQLKDERATSDATKAHIDLVMRLELASLAEQARAAHTAQEIALERSKQLFDAEAEIAAMHQELLTRTDAMSKRTQLVQARLEADYRRQLRDMREECRQDAIDSISEESRQALYASRKLTKQVARLHRDLESSVSRSEQLTNKLSNTKCELDISNETLEEQVRNSVLQRRRIAELEERARQALEAEEEAAALAQEKERYKTQLEEALSRCREMERAQAAAKREAERWRRQLLLERADSADSLGAESFVTDVGDGQGSGYAAERAQIQDGLGVAAHPRGTCQTGVQRMHADPRRDIHADPRRDTGGHCEMEAGRNGTQAASGEQIAQDDDTDIELSGQLSPSEVAASDQHCTSHLHPPSNQNVSPNLHASCVHETRSAAATAARAKPPSAMVRDDWDREDGGADFEANSQEFTAKVEAQSGAVGVNKAGTVSAFTVTDTSRNARSRSYSSNHDFEHIWRADQRGPGVSLGKSAIGLLADRPHACMEGASATIWGKRPAQHACINSSSSPQLRPYSASGRGTRRANSVHTLHARPRSAAATTACCRTPTHAAAHAAARTAAGHAHTQPPGAAFPSSVVVSRVAASVTAAQTRGGGWRRGPHSRVDRERFFVPPVQSKPGMVQLNLSGSGGGLASQWPMRRAAPT
uniref:Uncharacterized protein n=1 Tax=Chrysotila carterae TaxID=13221 RepID=A0A7S4B8B0_CHRCT